MKALPIVLGWFALIALVVIGVWAFRYYTADVRGRVTAEEQIQSAGSRIAGYDHFFNLCASIQSDEGSLDALAVELKTADANDRGRINANITGVTANRSRSINQYNADASKEYTEGQFRASSLPFQIPATAYTGAKTRCAS